MNSRKKFASTQFDWQAIKEQMRQREATFQLSSTPNDDRIRQAYRQRQVDYARRKTCEPERAARRRVLSCAVGSRRFGFDLSLIIKVFPLSQCTPVPGTAKEIIGVTNVDGAIRSVVDVAALVGLPFEGQRIGGHIVLLRHAGTEICIAVDHVEAIQSVVEESLARPAADETPRDGVNHEAAVRYIDGVAPDSLIVLDLPKLMSHPVFLSNSQVETVCR